MIFHLKCGRFGDLGALITKCAFQKDQVYHIKSVNFGGCGAFDTNVLFFIMINYFFNMVWFYFLGMPKKLLNCYSGS